MQRARSDYLKFGDSNTRWFHSKVNLRKVKNTIIGLIDTNGIWQMKLKDITNIVTQYFSELFITLSPMEWRMC